VLKSERRDHLLQSARDVFAAKGYHRASVADIIERADVARGTFYLHFTSKRHVFECILDQLLADLDARVPLVALAPGSPPPVEQLHGTVRQVLRLALEDRADMQILLRHATGLDPEVDVKLGEFYDAILKRIEAALRHGVALRLARPCHAQVAARCILGAVKEVASYAATPDGSSQDLDALLEEVMTFGLQAVQASGAPQSPGPGQI